MFPTLNSNKSPSLPPSLLGFDLLLPQAPLVSFQFSSVFPSLPLISLSLTPSESLPFSLRDPHPLPVLHQTAIVTLANTLSFSAWSGTIQLQAQPSLLTVFHPLLCRDSKPLFGKDSLEPTAWEACEDTDGSPWAKTTRWNAGAEHSKHIRLQGSYFANSMIILSSCDWRACPASSCI